MQINSACAPVRTGGYARYRSWPESQVRRRRRRRNASSRRRRHEPDQISPCAAETLEPTADKAQITEPACESVHTATPPGRSGQIDPTTVPAMAMRWEGIRRTASGCSLVAARGPIASLPWNQNNPACHEQVRVYHEKLQVALDAQRAAAEQARIKGQQRHVQRSRSRLWRLTRSAMANSTTSQRS